MRKAPEGLQVRPYRAEDFRSFYQLYAKVFAEPPWNENWTEAAVRKEVLGYEDKKNLNFLLATLPRNGSKNPLVGFSVAYETQPEAFPPRLTRLLAQFRMPIVYGDELAVDSEFRGLGIGSMLMGRRFSSFEDSPREGIIFVGRTDINSKMVPLYERLGYENSAINDPEYNSRYYFIKRA
ncbi:MAG: GNAT family N-acetyltransferase [Candidatus Micrarchaeaceae archaeon]|nr:GNAT family N-acetyltransferase [Candidatus Micrarchaeota archaeon]HII09906.1 GNAT family N-acetyltransferase [Candidatus Micrarchaeota archaeon]